VRGSLLIALTVVACVVAGAAAGPAPPAVAVDALEGGAKLEALIELVVERQRAVRSLRADFVLHKRSDLLLEEMVSSGEFLFHAPDRVRWDYRRPDRMVVVFADDTMTTFHPLQARAERVKVSDSQRRFVRVLAGTQPLDDLTTHFSVTLADPGGPAPYHLTLRPVDAMVKKKLRSVRLEVDRVLLLPVVVEYNEPDGDSTRYEFKNLVLNPEVDDSRFRLEFGSDVELQTIDASTGLG
jgi:outer membrane lipoprotein carrier protein